MKTVWAAFLVDCGVNLKPTADDVFWAEDTFGASGGRLFKTKAEAVKYLKMVSDGMDTGVVVKANVKSFRVVQK